MSAYDKKKVSAVAEHCNDDHHYVMACWQRWRSCVSTIAGYRPGFHTTIYADHGL